jgi:hypothetical protein
MAGLSGVSTAGVGEDIVSYLREAARFFKVTIHVTSGFRSADRQAQAMFDNWIHLERGEVYKKSTLPEADREKLDELFDTAHDVTSTALERHKATTDFLALAKERVGSKSLHTRGRAVDVRRAHIGPGLYKALTLHLQEVKEGKRTDIYHFQSLENVPAVDDAIKAQWQAILDGSHAAIHPPHAHHSKHHDAVHHHHRYGHYVEC